MYHVEDHHWWYRGMETITRAILDRWYSPGSGLRILDAGCGTGAAMTTYLAAYGGVVGLDLSRIALFFCRKRKAPLLTRASVSHLPFASRSFDLVASFDVLYERGVPDDRAAFQELARLLVPGGRLVLRLPAYDWLRGQHDEAVETARRYTRRQLSGLLRDSGLNVEHLSYANMLLFPFVLLKRAAERVWPPRCSGSDLTLETGAFNGLFRTILRLEAPLVAHLGLPYGSSVVAVGVKP